MCVTTRLFSGDRPLSCFRRLSAAGGASAGSIWAVFPAGDLSFEQISNRVLDRVLRDHPQDRWN